MKRMSWYNLSQNSYKCCSVCGICFVKDKTYLAKCENAVTDLLSQFVIPRKSDCQRQYDSHSYLLFHVSYSVNMFFKSKTLCAPEKNSLIFASTQQQKVTVFSFYSETFHSAALKHLMPSVLYFFLLKLKGKEKNHLNAYDYGRRV